MITETVASGLTMKFTFAVIAIKDLRVLAIDASNRTQNRLPRKHAQVRFPNGAFRRSAETLCDHRTAQI